MNRARIERIMHRQQKESAKYLRVRINEWMEFMRRAIIKALNEKYAKDEAAEIVATLTEWQTIEDEGIKIAKPAILRIMGKAGEKAFTIADIEGSFDVLNPRSVRMAETICGHMVREVTDETKKAIRTAIRDGYSQGKNMHQVAMQIRPRVGLTERQMKAVANYEEWILENRPELPMREVRRRVGVYERKVHRKRTDMIARTETARTVSEGSIQGYQEAGVKRVRFLGSVGCCPVCAVMDGNEYDVNEFSGVIPVHPNCTCSPAPVV